MEYGTPPGQAIIFIDLVDSVTRMEKERGKDEEIGLVLQKRCRS